MRKQPQPKVYFITKEEAEEREKDFRLRKKIIMKELKVSAKTIITN